MKNQFLKKGTLVFLIAMIFGTAMVVSAAEHGKPKYGGTIVQSIVHGGASLDAHLARGDARPRIGPYLGFLLYSDTKGNLLPGLAKSWEMPNRLTLILNLRKDVTFHDGTRFNADAVIFNFDRINGKTVPKIQATGKTIVSKYKTYEAVDDYTVKIVLKKPDPGVLSSLTYFFMPMMSPTAVKKYGEKFALNPVSCGPFVLKKYVPGSQILYERFDNYWKKDAHGRKLPYADRIKTMIISDHTTRAAALRAGTIDIDQFPNPKQAILLRRNKKITVRTITGNRSRFLAFNTGKPPMDNVWARKAINYAIDRREIIASAARGEGEVPNGWFPPVSWAYDPSLKWYEYDVAKAKDALRKAGMPNGFKIKAAGFDLQARSEAKMIQAQLKRVGIEMELDFIDLATFTTQYRKQGLYHAGFSGSPMVGIEAGTIYMAFHLSMGPYPDPSRPKAYDKLIFKANSMVDRKERKKVFAQLHQMVYDRSGEAYYIWSNGYRAYRSNLKNYTMQSDLFSCLEEVWLDK